MTRREAKNRCRHLKMGPLKGVNSKYHWPVVSKQLGGATAAVRLSEVQFSNEWDLTHRALKFFAKKTNANKYRSGSRRWGTIIHVKEGGSWTHLPEAGPRGQLPWGEHNILKKDWSFDCEA